MKDDLRQVLKNINEDYKENIDGDSRVYLEVSIAQKAAELGFSKTEARFNNAHAIVPIKRPVLGMKVRVDGRTFRNYAQFESGIVVPNYIARQVNLSHKAYIAKDSMIYNFA